MGYRHYSKAHARAAPIAGSALPWADHLILEAATGARELSPDELQQVLEHVAQAGFDPAPNVPAVGLAGVVWEGRALKGRDRITNAERHYLRHVNLGHEWPAGTSLKAYLASIQAVITDGRSGVATSRYQGQWQLTVVRRSQDLRGPDGFEWILVDYRVVIGYWVTAYQPRDGLRVLHSPGRGDVRWLRRPT
ncbi:MAG: hypothetical protein HY690_08835 [Chloroflexi bacterium]|nr:hypothetical protein [Chloroflexota bacterium]